MERIENAKVKVLCEKIDTVTKELTALKTLFLALDKPEMEELSDILSGIMSNLQVDDDGVQGIVFSVLPLDREEIKRLEVRTSELLKKKVLLKNEIDESLIGGFLISVDGKLIDASIKKKIEDMSLKIKRNVEGGSLL